MDKLIKQIIAEEFWSEPAIRADRRLRDIGATEADILGLDIQQGIKVKVANVLRNLETAKP